MSYFTAAKIGAALAKARVKAGLSQREMACMIEKNERTVQNWEKGQSSPDGDEIMDWFTACGASPLAAMQEMLHPELYRLQVTDMTDEELDEAIANFLDNSSRIVKEMILFIVLGKHGSYPPAVIAEICANLHTPLQNKVSVCGQVLDNYNCAVATHTDPVPDDVHPPVELLTTAYKSGKEASRRGETSYTTKRGRKE